MSDLIKEADEECKDDQPHCAEDLPSFGTPKEETLLDMGLLISDQK
jgi:hypothetical protein